MFGSIGGFEMLVLAIIGLLVFGPRRLPEIGRTLGKAMVEFRRAAMELRTSIEREVNLEEVKETTRTIQKAVGGDLLKDVIPKAGDLLPKMADILPEAAAVIPTLADEAAGIVREAAEPGDGSGPEEPADSARGEGRGTADAARRD